MGTADAGFSDDWRYICNGRLMYETGELTSEKKKTGRAKEEEEKKRERKRKVVGAWKGAPTATRHRGTQSHT